MLVPSIAIHLATATEYLKNHPEENKDDFIIGSISPDLVPDTNISHHSNPNSFDNGLNYLVGKVDLKQCLKDFDFGTSFGRGYFLHLITDKEFYLALSKTRDDFGEMSHARLKELLYGDYSVVNGFFKEKYGLTFPEAVKEYDFSIAGEPKLLDVEKICRLIGELGEMDLGEYYKQLA